MDSKSIVLLITALHCVHHFKEIWLFQNFTIENDTETTVCYQVSWVYFQILLWIFLGLMLFKSPKSFSVVQTQKVINVS